MTKQKPAQTLPTQILPAKTLEDRVADFLAEKKADEVYESEKLKIIQAKLVKRCEESGEDAVFEQMAEILKQRHVFARQYRNLRRQEFEIRNFELNPVKTDLRKLVSQMTSPMLQWSNSRHWWISEASGYGDSVPSFPSSVVGGSDDARNWVRNNSRPIAFTKKPPASYRNMVLDESHRVLSDIKRNSLEADIFLDEGASRKLTDSEEKSVRGTHPALHRLSNLAEAAVSGAGKVIGRFGQGIISKTNPIDTNRFKNLREEHNKMISQLMWRIGQHPRYGGAYLRALQRINDKLGDSTDFLDRVQFHEMQKIISEEIKQVEKVSEEELNKFNENIQKINDNMLEGLKKHVVTEDDMMKFRALQMFLMIAPFGGLAVFGLGNYLSVLGNLFGPLFDATLNFGEGLGHVLTSDVLGPFGDIVDALEIDVAVEWLANNLPGVGEATNLIDTVANEAGGIFGIAGQALTASAIPMMGVGLVYNLLRFEKEAVHHTEITNFETAERKKLYNAQRDFIKRVTEKGDDKFDVRKRILEFTTNEYNVKKLSHFYVKLADFIANADPKILEIFKDIKFTSKDNKTPKNFTEILAEKGGSLSQADVLDIILQDDNGEESKKKRKECMNLAAVFDVVYNDNYDDKKSFEDNLKDSLKAFESKKKNKEDFEKTAQEQMQKSSEEYTEEIARNSGFYSNLPEPKALDEKLSDDDREKQIKKNQEMKKARCADLEAQMIQRVFEERMRIEKGGIQIDDLPESIRPGKTPVPFSAVRIPPSKVQEGGRGGSAPAAA